MEFKKLFTRAGSFNLPSPRPVRGMTVRNSIGGMHHDDNEFRGFINFNCDTKQRANTHVGTKESLISESKSRFAIQ